MSELDWLEREERYRARFLRTFIAISILAAVVLGVGSWTLKRRQNSAQRAATQAADRTRLEEATKIRAGFVADSTAAAERVAAFRQKYGTQPLEGAPILLVPLPFNVTVARFLQEVWEEYTRAVDPQISAEKQREEFGLHYVDVMNMAFYNAASQVVWEGATRPQALLIPDVRQRGKDFEWEKASFPQIVRGQETIGLREVAAEAGTIIGETPVGETPAPGDGPPTEPLAPAGNPPSPSPPPEPSSPGASAPPSPAPPATPAPAPVPPDSQAAPKP